jgi:surface protein
LLFSACSDDGDNCDDDGDTILKGQLIDSAISGVRYETDSGETGYTDEKGTFSYNKTDKTITFTIGSLIIAKDFILSKLNNDGKILPADIVGVDRNNTRNEKLVKFLRVLQSLDNDNNASNGIFIDDNTKGYLDEAINIIDADISTLENMLKKALKTLKNLRKARMHYLKTLRDIQNGSTDALPFVTIWKTTSDDKDITIPIDSKYSYNYTVDWGDGTITKNINNSITHTYSSEGNHIVKISGYFPAIKTSSKKLQKITQWGDIAWSSFKYAFTNCSNLDVNATDTPSLSDVRSTRAMFSNTPNLKGNEYFNDWDVSSVTNMYLMFNSARVFNQPLNNWDVSSVTNMKRMFDSAKIFNQPLDNWDVGSVTNMYLMFSATDAFNQPLNNWDVSSVTDMTQMFSYSKAFNQPLNNWNVSNVIIMDGMFSSVHNANAFNQPLNNWDVSSVTDMRSMFKNADAFNQPLNKWNVSSVTNMNRMFSNADTFNQPLNDWDVSSVTDMELMFKRASAFTNQDLSSWNVNKVPSNKHDDFMTDSGGGNTEPSW